MSAPRSPKEDAKASLSDFFPMVSRTVNRETDEIVLIPLSLTKRFHDSVIEVLTVAVQRAARSSVDFYLQDKISYLGREWHVAVPWAPIPELLRVSLIKMTCQIVTRRILEEAEAVPSNELLPVAKN